MSLQCVAKKKNAKICSGYASFVLNVVCLLWDSLGFSLCGRFFGAYWHFVLWKLSANLLHCFTANGIRYQGQLNHPTPRMTKKLLCCILPHVPWAPLHPTICPSLKRKRICSSFILFKAVCHFQWLLHRNIITQTSLHLNIHSLLRMLQYLWPVRVCRFKFIWRKKIHHENIMFKSRHRLHKFDKLLW